jgi:hypothetical protein
MFGRCRGRSDLPAPSLARPERPTRRPRSSASSHRPRESPEPSQHREARHRQNTHRHRAQQQQNAVRVADRAGGLRHAQKVRRQDPQDERQRDRMSSGPGRHRMTSQRVGAVARSRRRGNDRSRRRRDRCGLPGRRAHDPGCDHDGRRARRGRRRGGVRDVRSGDGLWRWVGPGRAGRARRRLLWRRVRGGGRGEAAQQEQDNQRQRPGRGGRASGPRTSVRLPPVPLRVTSWSFSQRPFKLSTSY